MPEMKGEELHYLKCRYYSSLGEVLTNTRSVLAKWFLRGFCEMDLSMFTRMGVDVLRDRYKDPLQASSVPGPHGAVSAIALTPPQPLICHISVTFIDQWLGMPLLKVEKTSEKLVKFSCRKSALAKRLLCKLVFLNIPFYRQFLLSSKWLKMRWKKLSMIFQVV